ncbi:MAG: aminoglycoside 6'-N-acetyltransferase [Luteimonas sp.]
MRLRGGLVETDALSVTSPVMRRAGIDDAHVWSTLRAALWPDENPARHTDDIRAFIARGDHAAAFLAIVAEGKSIGFAEATLRFDYVNGTDSSPVGFLEGLYVVPAWRRLGVGRQLVKAIERWTLQQGCTELASDTWLDNASGQRAHLAYGFEETERVIYYRKRFSY